MRERVKHVLKEKKMRRRRGGGGGRKEDRFVPQYARRITRTERVHLTFTLDEISMNGSDKYV